MASGSPCYPVDVAYTIGFVEDEEVIRENFTDHLEESGFRVLAFGDRRSALQSFRESLPDLALLDVALGSERDGGFHLCKELRSLSEALPIIFLTSHDGEVDKISGLRLGADDYLSKEATLDFLVVRIETLLRRRQALAESYGQAADRAAVGDLVIDQGECVAYWKGRRVDMPLTQLWIVADLATRPGEPRSPQELMKAARIVVEPNTIAAHIHSIRQRFREIDPDFASIRTERGLGYRWLVGGA